MLVHDFIVYYTELRELLSDYKGVTNGFDRTYVYDCFSKDYIFEFSTPMTLVIKFPDEEIFLIDNRAWADLLPTLVNKLQDKYHKTDSELIDFRVDWSLSSIFSLKKDKVNMRKISDTLFFNINHTALHSFWLVGDLLKFYGVPTGKIQICRGIRGEPKKVISFIELKMKELFKEYLKEEICLADEMIKTVLVNIDILNGLLIKMKTANCNLYAQISTQSLSNCRSAFLSPDSLFGLMKSQDIDRCQQSLEYLKGFYSWVHIMSKKYTRNEIIDLNNLFSGF